MDKSTSTSLYGLDPDSDPDSGDPDAAEDDISTVSTIFGISLFFIFAVSVLVRKLYIHRRIRIIRSRNRARMLAALRMGEWDCEYFFGLNNWILMLECTR
jgi:hypothetical protein